MSALDPSWRPPHAYIPGKTPRHPEMLFDPLKAAVELQNPEACPVWRLALSFIEDGYFWEAHELLEAIWMGLPDGSADKLAVQALIQFANGKLKLEMERPQAAAKLASLSERLLADALSRTGAHLSIYVKQTKTSIKGKIMHKNPKI